MKEQNDMQHVIKQFFFHLRKTYGETVSMKIIEKKDSNLYEGFTTVKKSKLILDESTNKSKVRTLIFKNISSIQFDSFKNQFIDSLNRTEFISEVNSEEIKLNEKVEAALRKLVPRNFAQIGITEFIFSKIYKIFELMKDNDYINLLELEKADDYIRYKDYLNFLQKVDMIKIEERKIFPGKIFSIIQEKQPDNLIINLMGYLIAEHYNEMRDQLRLYTLEPFIKMATVYYDNAIELDDIIRLKPETLQIDYNNLFSQKPLLDVNYYLQRLIQRDILDVDGKFIVGKKEIFEKVKEFVSPVIITK